MSLQNLSEINPHLALWQSENWVSPVERAWEAWLRRVETLVGHHLDGHQARDGYSLDWAYGAFEAGETATSYSVEVMAADIENEQAFGPVTDVFPYWEARKLNPTQGQRDS